MKKFILIAAITAVLALTLTACNNSSGKGDETTTSADTTTLAETTAEETTPEDTADGENADEASETQKILSSIRDAYGDSYLPSASIADDLFEGLYGISAELYSEAAGDMMMIGTYPDTVMVFKAAEGKADDLEAALNALRDDKMADQMQYPINIAKVNATKVVRNGDYMAFLLVGAVDEREEATDDEAATFAEEQVQIAVDAFNGNF